MFGKENVYKTIQLSKGDVLFKAGDIVNKLFIVQAGEIICVCQNKDRIVPVYTNEHTGGLGEDGVFSDKRPSVYSAVALTDVRLMEIPKADIMKFMNSSSDWMKKILFNISEKVSKTTEVIADHKIIDDRFNGGKLLSGEEEVFLKKCLS